MYTAHSKQRPARILSTDANKEISLKPKSLAENVCWCRLFRENSELLLRLAYLLTADWNLACTAVITAVDQLCAADPHLVDHLERLEQAQSVVTVSALKLSATTKQNQAGCSRLGLIAFAPLIPPEVLCSLLANASCLRLMNRNSVLRWPMQPWLRCMRLPAD